MTKKKISYLLSKHSIRDTDVYSVIKEFFKEFLSAKYEFTFEELHEELKKIYLEKPVRDALINLIDKFRTIEYEDKEIPQEILKHILSEFNKVIDHLIVVKKDRSIFNRLFKKDTTLAKQPFPILQPKEFSEINTAANPSEEVAKIPTNQTLPSTHLAQENILAEPTLFQTQAVNNTVQDDTPSKNWSDSLHKPEKQENHSSDWTENQQVSENTPTKSMYTGDVQLQKKETGNYIFGQENITSLTNQPTQKTPTPQTTPVKKIPSTPITPVNKNQPLAEEVTLKKQTTPLDTKKDLPQKKEAIVRTAPTNKAPIAPLTKQPVQTNTPLQKESQPLKTEKTSPNTQTNTPLQKEKTPKQVDDKKNVILDLKSLAEELDRALETSATLTLDQMISSVKNHLSQNNVTKAKSLYKDLLGKYDELTDEDKHPYYDKIRRLYESMMSQK